MIEHFKMVVVNQNHQVPLDDSLPHEALQELAFPQVILLQHQCFLFFSIYHEFTKEKLENVTRIYNCFAGNLYQSYGNPSFSNISFTSIELTFLDK